MAQPPPQRMHVGTWIPVIVPLAAATRTLTVFRSHRILAPGRLPLVHWRPPGRAPIMTVLSLCTSPLTKRDTPGTAFTGTRVATR